MSTVLINKIVNSVRRVIQKIKEFFSDKHVQTFLICVTVAFTAFVAGKFLEQRTILQRLSIPPKPALPIYGTESALSPHKPVLTKTVFGDIPKTYLFQRFQLLPDFSVDAATTLPQVSSPTITKDDNFTPHAERVAQIMKFGFPGLDNVISYKDYVVSYDRRNRVAHWVFEHITQDSIKSNSGVDRLKCQFKEEMSIHPFFRANNDDYRRSGYDRGHLAAAGNHKSSQVHIEETFYLSNIAPQVGVGFNRDSWNRLEKYVRKLTKIFPNVYCCTGPLYLPKTEYNGKNYVKYEVIGANHVAVPTHFFKVVVGEKPDGTLEMECFVMENAPTPDTVPIESFRVSPDLVEKAAGLLFFTNANKKMLNKINGVKT